MVYSASSETYNVVFAENYNNLLKFCNHDVDRLHDTFIKVKERLEEISFTAHTESLLIEKIIAYTKTGLWNNWKTYERLKKNNVCPQDCYWELENKLLEEEELNTNHEETQAQLEYISKRLFEYIKLNYDTEWEYVFTVYYLYDANNKKITYNELSKITGYSISKCCMIIKTIKQDLRENLIKYANG